MLRHATGSAGSIAHTDSHSAPTLGALEAAFVQRAFDDVLRGCYRLLWRLTTAGSSPGANLRTSITRIVWGGSMARGLSGGCLHQGMRLRAVCAQARVVVVFAVVVDSLSFAHFMLSELAPVMEFDADRV